MNHQHVPLRQKSLIDGTIQHNEKSLKRKYQPQQHYAFKNLYE